MDKEKALATIDAAIKALTELEHSINPNDRQNLTYWMQVLWLELGNLREMVESMKDEDN
jgi:hypothetical protein